MFKKNIFTGIFAILAVMFAFGIYFGTDRQTTLAQASEYMQTAESAEKPQYELSPNLNNFLYSYGSPIEVDFILNSQYSLVNVTSESQGFDITIGPIFDSESSTISIVLTHIIDYIDCEEVIETEAKFTLTVEVLNGDIFSSSIYGYSTANGIYISQYRAEKYNTDEYKNYVLENNNQISTFSDPVVNVSGKLKWWDSDGNLFDLRRTRVEFTYATDLGNGTFMPWAMYYQYTNDSGNYSFSLTNPFNMDISLRVYA